MICEQCSVEIITLMDQVNHVCPQSSLCPKEFVLPDIDEIILKLIELEDTE